MITGPGDPTRKRWQPTEVFSAMTPRLQPGRLRVVVNRVMRFQVASSPLTEAKPSFVPMERPVRRSIGLSPFAAI